MKFEQHKNTYTLAKNDRDDFTENPNIYGDNRLDLRSNVIPSEKRGVYFANKYDSQNLFDLDGDYKFKWLPSDDGKDEYFSIDLDDASWDVIDVPSMWQYRGYGVCTYPNVQYHFPFDPPFIHCEKPIGIYRRTFVINDKSPRSILHFCGVDNAFFVYVNGKYAGFGKGSRNAVEFDVTDFLVTGENLLAVKVNTWSDGSYLEDQDMLLSSGIFRDVYLINTDKVSVWDYHVYTDMENIYYSAVLSQSDENTVVRFTADGKTVDVKPQNNVASAVFHIENPRLWNAETPEIYETFLELVQDGKITETHSKRVGLCESRVEGNKFLVNKKPVMLKGVNRHEHNMKNGKAVDISQIEYEIKLMKQFNINAVRCSHYTNNPAFYELCLIYGIYVMDEADIESHGAEITGDQGILSKTPEWLYAYMFRTRAMVENNKNECAIVIWSIGNECGWGENLERCAEYLHGLADKKPVHQSQSDPMNPVYDDFRKNGYCTFASMDKYGVQGKPVVLTEYAHGMGNAPGCLEDYWNYFYSHEQYCGGFVWEFKSHGFYSTHEDGAYFVKYGGDFDPCETNHWKNFTLDGYLRSDLTPKPGLYELKEAHSPVIPSLENGKIVVRNTNDFRDLSYLTLCWSIMCDCDKIRCGRIDMPKIKARQSAVLDINTSIENPISGAVYRADLEFYDGARLVAHRQLELAKIQKSEYIKADFDAEIKTNFTALSVIGKDFEVTFENGVISKYIKSGKAIISTPMTFSFYRALLDNDDFRRSGNSVWESARLPYYGFFAKSVTAQKLADEVIVSVEGKTTGQGQYAGFDWEIKYHVYKGGLMLFDMTAKPYGHLPEKLLRIGVDFSLDKSFDSVGWYGRGDGESYCDRKLACPFGYYEKKLSELNFEFEMPQDSGTRIDNSFIGVSSENASLNIIGSDSFIFSYQDCTTLALDKAMHKGEVAKSSFNHLHIDYAMRGLGNHSCGPEPEAQYELYPHTFRFAFILGACLGKSEMTELTRADFGVRTSKLADSYTRPTITETIQMFNCTAEAPLQ